MEQIDLTTPIVKADISYWKVVSLHLDWEAWHIGITLKNSESGEIFHCGYSGETAYNLMRQMNKKDFSTTSMHKTILNKLVNDGVLVGTVSGSPD